MSKLFKLLTTMILALSLSVFFIACDKGGETSDSGDATTGEFIYELATGEDDAGEEYEYYKITGYTVTSEDALKMANGDFSTVSGKRDIVIPNEYNGKSVEEIAPAAFADRIIIKSIKFELDTKIKTIGAGAFSGCANLEEIINLPFIGKSVDAAGEERVLGFVFGSGTAVAGLTDVTAKAYDELTTTDLTFKVPSNLKKITFVGEKVTECAFFGFNMLEEIVMDNATFVGASAFSGCVKLISVNLPAVTFINDNAFAGCSALQRVAFGSALEFIGDGAFNGCSYLGYNYVTEDESAIKLVIPASVKYIGNNAFAGCALLKYVEIGAGVTEIKTGVFSGCSDLKKVTANSDIRIQISAFAGCNKDKLYLNGKKFGDVDSLLGSFAFGEIDLT